MALSNFLRDVASGHGADSLEGAMVFVMLQRPIDELISRALALGPYHRGRPSPWSHCFLLAEPFTGPTTKILDCTIRNAQGRVEWTTTLPETIDILAQSTVGKGAGGVYDGTLADYDDSRVIAHGVRWLPGLAPDQRGRIVAQGRALQQAQIRYDLPGLVRELVRLLMGVAIPPADQRLFCSAFLQTAYRQALGDVGDFTPNVADADTTPDDLWYSNKGIAIADVSTVPEAHEPVVATLFGQSGPAAARQSAAAVPLATLDNAPTTKQEIERVLALLQADPKLGSALQDYERVRSTLENALAQLDRAQNQGALGQSSAVLHSDDHDLSLVQSAIDSPKDPTAISPLFGRDLGGFQQYENLDPGWIASLWNRITRSTVPFPVAKNVLDVVYQIPDVATIAIAGDWGTGNMSSQQIATEIDKRAPDYTIHLGDVYYSGTESEERKRLVELWPAGTSASLALNSNHEMYSGGHGYFGVALSHQRFRLQHGYSYFALYNAKWLIIGLDSAYAATSFYQNGALNDPQILWLRALLQTDMARSDGALKDIIVLSHHQGLDFDGRPVEPLFSQVTRTLGQGPQRWYWGHVHGVAAFAPIDAGGVQLRARLVGHGGVPYAPDPQTPALAWTENALAGDPHIPERAPNGFALLSFGAAGLSETLYDEFGNARWHEP